MKMRKRIAALMAVVMIAALMPMSAFADSTNRVDKVITIEKDKQIKGGVAPELKIKMKDDLTQGLSFYLELTGAKWAPMSTDEITVVTTATVTTGAAISFSHAAPTYVNDINGFFGKLNSMSNVTFTNQAITDTTEDTRLENEAIREAIKANVKEADEKGINGVYTKSETYNRPVKAIEFEVTKSSTGIARFEAYRENDKTMAIKLIAGTFEEDDEFIFPLLAEVTDSEAIVSVRRHDTEVTNSEHMFAVSDGAKTKVLVGDAPNFYRTTTIADITIEELFANSVSETDLNERWFTLELRDTDFTFVVDEDAKIVGERAYRDYEIKLKDLSSDGKANYELSRDNTRLGIRIDDSISAGRERGNFVLKGIKVVADRDARNGEVKATIDSNTLFKKDIITIANRGDYKTKLDVPEDWDYEVIAGNEKEVKFILSEELANSLTGTRPVTFTFDQGVKIKTNVNSSSKNWEDDRADYILWGANATHLDRLIDAIEAATSATDLAKAQAELYKYLYDYDNKKDNRPGDVRISVNKDIIAIKGDDVEDEDKGDWDAQLNRVHIAKDRESFTVDNFNVKRDKAGKYTFTTTLLVPANVKGEIKVAVTGSGVTEEEIVILKAEAPVEVEATKMDIKVGLKEIETTGKVVIKETAKERLAQGKDLVLRVDEQDSGLKIKSYKATVVEGDLVLADRKDTDRIIGVKRVSTEPSTIEITDIVMSTDRTVPEGKYNLVVGGNAISSITRREEFAKNDHFEIDPVAVVEDFINITTKNTEDIAGSANKAKVAFVVGSTEYLVNGKVEQMDVAPYIKDGRTMVPVRYVAAALGVKPDQVIWDGVNQTATVLADKIIQVKLGSKMMLVNGVSFPMTAAAELVSDRTFVPVAEMARALGVPVDWAADNATATFN